MLKRIDGREYADLRTIKIQRGVQKDPIGSVLIEWGNTKVICSASLEERLPPWMSASAGKGWITAEYGMLPGSTDKRINRDKAKNSGRTQEIQRLIGRSLRACIPLKDLGPRTLQFDCDVLQADGGTRVASITGSYLALKLAIDYLIRHGQITKSPRVTQVAAVSIGRVEGEIIADLNYHEDSRAELDANVVMTAAKEFIELQGTAEDGSFTRSEWDLLLDRAETACSKLFEIQNAALAEWDLKS